MLSLIQIRQKHYDHQRKKLINMDADIDDWKFSPYNCFKSRIYIELSSILAFILQYTKITPNQITYIYLLCGVIGGILLSLEYKSLLIIGCLIFYFKGILDWTDGLIARIKQQTSSIGHILDAWASNVGYICFVSGITIHCYGLTNNTLYLFILICFLIFKSLDFKNYLYQQSYYEISNNSPNIEDKIKEKSEIKKKKENFFYIFIKSFMDDRARTTDSVILVILLNLIYDLNIIIEIIVILYFLKSIIIFFGHVYFFAKKKGN